MVNSYISRNTLRVSRNERNKRRMTKLAINYLILLDVQGQF